VFVLALCVCAHASVRVCLTLDGVEISPGKMQFVGLSGPVKSIIKHGILQV